MLAVEGPAALTDAEQFSESPVAYIPLNRTCSCGFSHFAHECDSYRNIAIGSAGFGRIHLHETDTAISRSDLLKHRVGVPARRRKPSRRPGWNGSGAVCSTSVSAPGN